jgi:integrase
MSIQKKGDTYYVVVMYRDLNDKKKYKWYNAGPSISIAEKMERSIRTDIERGDKVISPRMKLDQFLNQWLETAIAPKKRPSTVAFYGSLMKNVSAGIGNVDLDKLTTIKIQQYLNKELKRKVKPQYIENPKRKPHKEPLKIEKTISPTSVRKQFSMLKQSLDKAVQWGLIPKNPCGAVDPPANSKPKQAAYSPEEAQRLLDVAKDTMLNIPVMLGIQCGLRRGEVCGLRWQDVNLGTGKAFINKTLE